MKKRIARLTVTAVLLSVIISSCSTRNGYGCRGRESWGHMVNRINRP